MLLAQGYVGQGLELRPRKTWAGYPELTQSRLKKHAVDPTILLEQCSAHDGQGSPFDPSSFFIGNHADEMTVSSSSSNPSPRRRSEQQTDGPVLVLAVHSHGSL